MGHRVIRIKSVWGRKVSDGHGSVLVLADLRDFVVVKPWDHEAGRFEGIENVPRGRFLRDYWHLRDL